MATDILLSVYPFFFVFINPINESIITMTSSEILALRLTNHGLTESRFKSPEEVVQWMGAIQAQDFPSSRWGIGIRLPGSTEKTILNALNKGSIIRTSALRGTLHLVHCEDIKWVLELSADAVVSKMQKQYHASNLDEKTFTKAFKIFTREMEGKHLTRKELYSLLTENGISTEGSRGNYLLNRAALQQIICHGPMRGQQITFTLLDTWAPKAKSLKRSEAIVELAQRYFQSHGPATVADFMNWSGLSNTEAKNALDSIKTELTKETIDNIEYWFYESTLSKDAIQSTFILPAFDEYILGYKNRELFLSAENNKQVITVNGIFNPTIIMKGSVTGIWKKEIVKDKVVIETNPFLDLSKAKEAKVKSVAAEFGSFLDKEVEIRF